VKAIRTGMSTPVGSDIGYFNEITMLKAMEGSVDM
jgi:recombinational DNA repair protein RecR